MDRFLITACLVLIGLLGPISMTARAQPQAAPVVAAIPDAEIPIRRKLFDTIKASVDARDFDTLSAMEERFRLTRSRTPSGVWELDLFYQALDGYLSEGLRAGQNCKAEKANFVDQWQTEHPNNPAPVIVQAKLLEWTAWCYRDASSLNVDWDHFYKTLTRASTLLERHKAMASRDPEYYAVAASIYRGLGVTGEAYQAFLDEATEREPAYLRTYSSAFWSFMPQWGGSAEEMESFARYAMDKARATEGTGMYVRLLWQMDSCDCQLIQQVSRWSVLRQSMLDVYSRFPVERNRRFFERASCQKRQLEEARHYVGLAHPENDWLQNTLLTSDICEQVWKEERE
ncbi:hypothetical protein PbB2_02631 [Candidatus Phycosocius bacilliformis]|uniref:DUF4034 domain-containing protein n=2 Tax=Candidatus Phycosocius bacilliformis TaxID=1445552 RepID=A0A2P2ED09_9PROT|nr:hypothetical protein PbB2_02631 [Candidatus Phycosocius bacilliformis]